MIDAVHLGSAADGEDLIRPLRASGSALTDTFGIIPASELSRLHGDPEQPTSGLGDGHLLRELNADTVEAIVRLAGPDSASPLIGLELRHLDGALARAPEGHGALACLDGAFSVYGVGAPIGPDETAAINGRLDAIDAGLRPWKSDRRFLNFVDRAADPAACFDPATYQRLREVKARYDGDGLFLANHPIPPEAATWSSSENQASSSP